MTKPPKEWFYAVVRKIEKEAPDVINPSALAGWIWYHHMKPTVKKTILKAVKLGRKYKLGIRKITARLLKKWKVLDPAKEEQLFWCPFCERWIEGKMLESHLRENLQKFTKREIAEILRKTIKKGYLDPDVAKTIKKLNPEIKVRRHLIKQPKVIGWEDFDGEGTIRVLEREDDTFFPEFAVYINSRDSDLIDSLKFSGLKQENRDKWVLRTDKFNLFVYIT